MSVATGRKLGRQNFQTSLLILIAAIASVSLLVQVFSIQPYIQSTQIEIIQDEQATATANLLSILSGDMDHAESELTGIAKLQKFKEMDVPGLKAPLKLLTTISHSFDSFFVLNASGWFVAGTVEDIVPHQSRSFADSEFFSQPFNADTTYFGAPQMGHRVDSVRVTLSVPIYDSNGDTTGVLLGTVYTEEYLHTVHDFTLEEGITAIVVDQSGIVFVHSGLDLFSLEDGPLSLNYSTNPCVQLAITGESGRGQHIHAGDEVFGTWASYEKAGWGVVLTSPIQSILERTDVLTNRLLLINILVFVSTLGVSFVLTRRISENQEATREEIEFLARFPQENTRPVLRINREGVVLYANEAAESQLVGWNPAIGDQVSAEWLNNVTDSLDSGLKTQHEYVFGGRTFSFNVAPITESGYVNFYGNDITEQKKAETAVLHHSENLAALVAERTQELEESNKQLLHLDEMKNSFISSAAHELRTPLTTIKGYQELVGLHNADIPETVRKYRSVVTRSTDRLIKITDDLLDLQRINTGRLELNKETVDIVQLVDNVVDELSLVAKERDVELIVDHQDPIESYVDPLRVSQVITNIIHNAIKFSEDGGQVSVSTSLGDGFAVITCKDDGIGIDENDQARLFTPFPGIIRDNKYRSTGLGLSIAKGIVELHGGTVLAESEGLGKGSRFTFTIPIQ